MIHVTATWFTKPAAVAVILFIALAVGCGRGKSSTAGAPPDARVPGDTREPAAGEPGTARGASDSPDVGSLLASSARAKAAESVAQRTYQREKDLFARRISA